MGWVKLDDTFAEHPKVELAGDEAAWLYVSALLYSYRADTDGFIPAAKVPKLTGLRSPHKLAERLVEVRLWDAVEDGYVIHDYLKHQQSAAERQEQRDANAERARKAREKKRQRHSDVTPLQKRTSRGRNGVSNDEVTLAEGEGDREGEVLPNDRGGTSSVSGVPLPPGASNVVGIDRSTTFGDAA